MFGWLEDEIARIKTRKFHLVDGPASPRLREAVESSDAPLPPSYKEFVLRFGNADLYRCLNFYLVRVYAAPREAQTASGEPLIHFGRTETSLSYFKKELLVEGGESPVFEWRYPMKGVTLFANGFEEWLEKKGKWARRQFKKKDWKKIEEGPPPFTPEEQLIVKARRLFRWKYIGISGNDALRFEVHNGSAMILPYLTIGLRDTRSSPEARRPEGGVWLPVSSVLPGATKVIEHSCSNPALPPEFIKPVPMPDPGPEDRHEYWEFRDDCMGCNRPPP
jgi:hypothetical protein